MILKTHANSVKYHESLHDSTNSGSQQIPETSATGCIIERVNFYTRSKTWDISSKNWLSNSTNCMVIQNNPIVKSRCKKNTSTIRIWHDDWFIICSLNYIGNLLLLHHIHNCDNSAWIISVGKLTYRTEKSPCVI